MGEKKRRRRHPFFLFAVSLAFLVLGAVAVLTSGSSGSPTFVAYWNTTNTTTGDGNLTWNWTTQRLSVLGVVYVNGSHICTSTNGYCLNASNTSQGPPGPAGQNGTDGLNATANWTIAADAGAAQVVGNTQTFTLSGYNCAVFTIQGTRVVNLTLNYSCLDDTFYLLSNPLGFYNSSTLPAYPTPDNASWNESRGNEIYLLNTGDTATGNYTFDTTTLHIDSTNDRVGIGTTTPTTALDVLTNARDAFAVRNSTKTFLYVDTNDTTGYVGIGTSTPGDGAGISATQEAPLHVYSTANKNTFLLIQNVNVTSGGSGAAVLRTLSDTASMNFQSHTSARTISRWGVTLGGWNEFLSVTGNGFALGSSGATPVLIGTASVTAINITTSQEVAITGIKDDGTGKVVCVKSDKTLGTCSSAVGAGGTCTCG